MESTRQHSLENILGLKQFCAIADFGASMLFRAAKWDWAPWPVDLGPATSGGFLRRCLGLGQQPHQLTHILGRQIGKKIGDPRLVFRSHSAEFGTTKLCEADDLDAAVGL